MNIELQRWAQKSFFFFSNMKEEREFGILFVQA